MSISEGLGERFVNSAAEQRALKLAANRYCDAMGWPTIILLAVVAPSYFALPILAALGWVSHWFVVPAMAFLTYAAYTPMHEAAHGSVCGAGRRFRWVNDAVGYVAGLTLAIPYTAHRFEHFTHHAHTNDAECDPDLICADMTQSAWQAVVCSSAMLTNQYRFFMAQCWATATIKVRLNFVVGVSDCLISCVVVICAARARGRGYVSGRLATGCVDDHDATRGACAGNGFAGLFIRLHRARAPHRAWCVCGHFGICLA